MLRYHKKVYIAPQDVSRLKVFTEKLNTLEWKITPHALDNIKYRAIDIEGMLLFIRDVVFYVDDVFEFYKEELSNDILKACYRIKWLETLDLILVMGKDKQIITIYINSASDNHDTLKRELYITEQ